MSFIVVTTEGTTSHYKGSSDPTSDDHCDWSEQTAQTVAERANRQAEALGIKTRYEIKELA